MVNRNPCPHSSFIGSFWELRTSFSKNCRKSVHIQYKKYYFWSSLHIAHVKQTWPYCTFKCKLFLLPLQTWETWCKAQEMWDSYNFITIPLDFLCELCTINARCSTRSEKGDFVSDWQCHSNSSVWVLVSAVTLEVCDKIAFSWPLQVGTQLSKERKQFCTMQCAIFLHEWTWPIQTCNELTKRVTA